MRRRNEGTGPLQICGLLRFKTSFWFAYILAGCLLAIACFSPIGAAQTTAAWTWVGGSSRSYQPGQYGTLGTPALGNIPPGRWDAATWKDPNGNFWLFGGLGYNAATDAPGVLLRDMWEYLPSSNEWAWMGGDDVPGTPSPGVYGTLGKPNAANIPGRRSGAAAWTDQNGNLWLFGGTGYDAAGKLGDLNDVWEYSPSIREWTWMGGSNTVGANNGQPGIYGTRGTAAAGNIPGGRTGAVAWTGQDGNFWLFGGTGYDANGVSGALDDLWKFDPSANVWSWVSGNSTLPQDAHGWPGVYGTLGAPNPENLPGGRSGATGWSDGNDNLWLFGGAGIDVNGNATSLNDLWRYDLSTKMWTWMGGSTTATGCSANLGIETCTGQPGIYGTARTPSAAGNIPGGRSDATSWSDDSGNFWLFGGQGYDAAGNDGNLNDLWMFSPDSNEWICQGGNTTATDCIIAPEGNPFCKGQPGVYGSLGVPGPGNEPGGRYGASRWVDNSGNFWLFGGYGADSAGNSMGVLNDLWEYQQTTTALPAAATPSFSPDAGTYSSSQTVTLSDTTPGATIYYTTDESVPTPNSSIYGGPITISSSGARVSETIHAIAAADGYSLSSMASATYAIHLQPDFSLSGSPDSLKTNAGQTGSITITVTPVNGFNSSVSFGCSGLPPGASCSFSPATVTPNQAPASTTLTLSTSAATAMSLGSSSGFQMTAFAVVFCFIRFKRRRFASLILLMALCTAWLGLLSGCGSGSATSHPTTTTVTVIATSGSLHHSATFL